MIDAMVKPSIDPLALTNRDAGNSSVKMPAPWQANKRAAPKPTMAVRQQGGYQTASSNNQRP
jgi:hypothetical protein